MDSTYLKANVMDALTEALTSMAVKMPDDEIEYLGRYLETYVERKKAQKVSKEEADDVEAKYKVYLAELEVKKMLEDEKNDAIAHFEGRFERFVESIQTDFSTKQSAMEAVVNFIESSLETPAAYIAVKKVVGESEVLNYVAASSSQKHILGKTLPKVVAEDGDEAPPRQGVSFEAFKLPEVPEEEGEAEEPAEGEEAAPPKPPPVAQPLIIDNVMRDTRCKFFAIPRLGSFVAVPFAYQSVDHEGGVALVGEEGGETPPELAIVKKEAQFIIAVDSIGAFRAFKPVEVERLKKLGDELVKLFERLETSMGEDQLLYMKGDQFKSFCDAGGGEFATAAAEKEAAATAKCAEAIAADPAMAEEGVSELLKPWKEAVAVAESWNAIASADNITAAMAAMKGYVLPPPAPVLNLLYAVCCLIGFAPTDTQNVCGDPDWSAIRKNCLTSLLTKIAQYNPSEELLNLPNINTLAAVKAFAEANGILDGGAFPANMPICGAVFVPWLTKAIAAREAAIAYFAEAEQKALE